MQYNYTRPAFDSVIFLEGLSTELRDLVVAVQYIAGDILIHTSADLTTTQESTLSSYASAHDPALPVSAGVQKIRDMDRFTKRAQVKDQIMAEMASENMARLRDGTWTVAQLIGLTSDAQLKDLLDDINTLSFELAYAKVDGLTNAALTTAIKNEWKTKLASHFYA